VLPVGEDVLAELAVAYRAARGALAGAAETGGAVGAGHAAAAAVEVVADGVHAHAVARRQPHRAVVDAVAAIAQGARGAHAPAHPAVEGIDERVDADAGTRQLALRAPACAGAAGVAAGADAVAGATVEVVGVDVDAVAVAVGEPGVAGTHTTAQRA